MTLPACKVRTSDEGPTVDEYHGAGLDWRLLPSREGVPVLSVWLDAGHGLEGRTAARGADEPRADARTLVRPGKEGLV